MSWFDDLLAEVREQRDTILGLDNWTDDEHDATMMALDNVTDDRGVHTDDPALPTERGDVLDALKAALLGADPADHMDDASYASWRREGGSPALFMADAQYESYRRAEKEAEA